MACNIEPAIGKEEELHLGRNFTAVNERATRLAVLEGGNSGSVTDF